jgi:hypothetical protein
MPDLTPLQEIERLALVSADHNFRSRLVSAVRQYRNATAALLSSRYSDGEVDAVALNNFVLEIERIEQAEDGAPHDEPRPIGDYYRNTR